MTDPNIKSFSRSKTKFPVNKTNNAALSFVHQVLVSRMMLLQIMMMMVHSGLGLNVMLVLDLV